MGLIALRPREKWIPVAKSKYVRVPEIDLDLQYDDSIVKDLPDAQRKVFYERLNKLFADAYQAKKAEKAKEIQRLIIKIEDRVPQLAAEGKGRAENLIAQENGVLKAEMAKWAAELTTMCEMCVARAREESFLAMKLRVVKAKVGAIVHVIVVLAIALIAAAAVVTGGDATAPALYAAVKVLYGAIKTMGPKWITTKNAIDKLSADLATLAALAKKYDHAAKSYASPLDKAKAFLANLASPMSEIERDLASLDKYVGADMLDLKEQEDKLRKLESLATTNPKMLAKIAECQKAIDKAKDHLKYMADIKNKWAEVKKELAAAKTPNLGAINTVVARVASASPELSLLFNSVKSITDYMA